MYCPIIDDETVTFMSKTSTKKSTYIMIAVEQNQERANCGRKEKQSVFGEYVRIESTVSVALPDFVLGGLVMTV